ncbi:unnamed protein product [Cyclocybe aegerita]|uniref:Uncharacterized protein n=1 Tax=Cyclocybe aegerita TaxID=1973307 RepID=A0A8S0VUZ6_CYCAE|nr:unnamed protein product [Cyclocybe aegerita]
MAKRGSSFSKTLVLPPPALNIQASIPIDLYVAKIKEEIVNYFVNEDDVVIGNIRPDPTIVKALDFALDALPAVRHFEMAINRDAMEVLCKAATSSTFERLESLVVEQYFHIGIRVKEKFLFAFPPAPRLRRVALDRYNCTPSFFWSQLTHLCVSSEITEDDWLEVLKNCANLVCGAFKIGPDDEPAKSERLIHTNLCQLILAPICFRSVVSFPALKALRLLRNETDHTLMALTELLMATPVLRELHFDSEIFNPAIFSFDSAIETTDGLREILPDLDHLVFDATRCSTDSGGDTVVRLLRSGWMELAPHSGARGHLLIIFDPEYQSMNSPITPEEFDVIRKSEVARALEEFQSGQERSYDVQLCYPSVGGRRRDCQPNLENLPNWDEFMGFHDKVSLPMQ